MAVDIEFSVNSEYREALSKVLVEEDSFKFRKPEIIADLSFDLLSFVYTGSSSIIFGVLANILYSKVAKKDKSKKNPVSIKITLVDRNGERHINIDSESQMRALNLETEGGFLSLEIK